MKLPEDVTCSQCILQVHIQFIQDEDASVDVCHQNELNIIKLNLLPVSSLIDISVDLDSS